MDLWHQTFPNEVFETCDMGFFYEYECTACDMGHSKWLKWYSSLVRTFRSHSYVMTRSNDVINIVIGTQMIVQETQANANERKHANDKRKILLALAFTSFNSKS